MKLTEKQKRFADYYIETGNATEAAIRSGYSRRTAKEMGYENLTKPHIKGYIDAQLRQKDHERIASADEVLELLTRMARGEIKEEQVVAYRKHYEIATRQVAPRDRIKAAELLGKRYSLFTDNVRHSGEVGINIEVDYAEEDDESEGALQ